MVINRKTKVLIDYGTDFLTKSIETILVNGDFFILFKNKFSVDYYNESKPHKWLVEKIFQHYDSYNTIPTIDILTTLNQINLDINIKPQIEKILDVIKLNVDLGYGNDHYQFYIDELKDFRTRKLYEKQIRQWATWVQENDFDKINNSVHETVQDVDYETILYDYEDDYEDRHKPLSRKGISTGWRQLDAIMEGTGPAPGEVCVIQAETGAGKSWIKPKLAINALKQGKNVLYVTLETRKRTLAKRFDSLISGIPFNDLYNRKEEAKDIITKFFTTSKCKLFIEEYPDGGCSIPDIYALCKRIKINTKQKIDLLIVDYLEIMDLSAYEGADWQKYQTVYRKARRLGFELDFPVWTSTHPNTDGIKSDLMTYGQTAGGPNKFKNVDFIMTFNKRLENQNPLGILYIAKNRIGSAGLMYKMILDTFKPEIDITDTATRADLKQVMKGSATPDNPINANESFKALAEVIEKTFTL